MSERAGECPGSGGEHRRRGTGVQLSMTVHFVCSMHTVEMRQLCCCVARSGIVPQRVEARFPVGTGGYRAVSLVPGPHHPLEPRPGTNTNTNNLPLSESRLHFYWQWVVCPARLCPARLCSPPLYKQTLPFASRFKRAAPYYTAAAHCGTVPAAVPECGPARVPRVNSSPLCDILQADWPTLRK